MMQSSLKMGLTLSLQLYSSMDFGRKWQLVHDNVMPGRFYWYDYVDPIFELD